MKPDSSDQIKLLNRLEECKAKKLSFVQAKQALLQEGFSEKDITLMTLQFPYDSLEGTSDDARIKATYLGNPDQAGAVATSVEKNYQREQQDQATLDYVASQAAPDIQSNVEFTNRFLGDVGMSWTRYLLVSFTIAAIAIAVQQLFHWPYTAGRIIVTILSAGLAVYLIKRAD